jgi:hypothetical protein
MQELGPAGRFLILWEQTRGIGSLNTAEESLLPLVQVCHHYCGGVRTTLSTFLALMHYHLPFHLACKSGECNQKPQDQVFLRDY